QIFLDVLHTCRALGIALCGGHTEVTLGLPRPIVVGQMLGEAKKSELIRKESQRPGDLIILTRGVAIEGSRSLASAWYVLRASLPDAEASTPCTTPRKGDCCPAWRRSPKPGE